MQISQIYFSDSSDPPPPYVLGCIKSVRESFPDYQHQLLDLPMARLFLSEKYGGDVLNAFEMLKPYAYKSDLLRYCLLYEIGGWYFDAAIRPVSTIEVPESIETIAFKDMPIYSQTSWSCLNGVLYSRPRNPVYETAIRLVLENCKNLHYGINAICPTGPALLGRAFAVCGESPSRIFGDFTFLTPLHPNRNPAFVLPDGLIFALGKPSEGGDMAALGASGTNNYNEIYSAKNIYSEASSRE
jgi:hypothetical protein